MMVLRQALLAVSPIQLKIEYNKRARRSHNLDLQACTLFLSLSLCVVVHSLIALYQLQKLVRMHCIVIGVGVWVVCVLTNQCVRYTVESRIHACRSKSTLVFGVVVAAIAAVSACLERTHTKTEGGWLVKLGPNF